MTKYTNWHDGRRPRSPHTTCSPNLQLINKHLAAEFGMWSVGCYHYRKIRGATRWSAHAFGAALDMSYRRDDDHPTAPTRKDITDVIIPWLEANADTLGLQRIHDYWGRRYWQVGRGWINRPPGGRNDHLHLEVSEESWGWDTPIKERDGAPAPAKAAPVYPGTVTKRGSKAKARVKVIQAQLAERNYNVGPVDGDFGPMTEAAVKAFQTDAGLEADGLVGPNTWRTLFG